MHGPRLKALVVTSVILLGHSLAQAASLCSSVVTPKFTTGQSTHLTTIHFASAVKLTEIPLNSVGEYFTQPLTVAVSPTTHLRTPILRTIGKTSRAGQSSAQETIDELIRPGAVFNYVLTPHGLIFRKTGASLGADVLSKHILLAGPDPVLYAGDLWRTEDDVLHLTNESGSFAPNGQELVYLASLLKNELGLAAVEVHPHGSEGSHTRPRLN